MNIEISPEAPPNIKIMGWIEYTLGTGVTTALKIILWPPTAYYHNHTYLV